MRPLGAWGAGSARVGYGAPTLLCLALASTALAGCLAPTTQPLTAQQAAEAAAAAVSSFTELLCDPACNIQLSREAGPGNEVALAMDPHNPMRLLGGAKDYNDRYTDCVTISWYYSEDGGRSWREGYFHEARALALPHPPAGLPVPLPVDPDARSCESDPVPVFDGHGNALMSTLSYGGSEPPAGLPTYRLRPNATAWEPVAHAYEGSSDKQWADVDPASGEVYVVTRDLKEGSEHVEELVKTGDGGETWQHVASFDVLDFAQVAVRPGGHLYLAGLAVDDAPGTKVVALHSADGGATWGEPSVIAELGLEFSASFLGGTKGYRTPPLPAIAAADGAPRVAVAYFDDAGGGDWDVFVRVSRDGGATWDGPVRVNDDGMGADQWTPAVALGPAGDVHVLWFDARHDPTGEGRVVDLYYGHSRDGIAFDANLRVTEDSFVPYLSRHQAQPFFIGDYLGIAASDEEAVMIWPDTRHGRSDVFAAIVGGPPAERALEAAARVHRT